MSNTDPKPQAFMVRRWTRTLTGFGWEHCGSITGVSKDDARSKLPASLTYDLTPLGED